MHTRLCQKTLVQSKRSMCEQWLLSRLILFYYSYQNEMIVKLEVVDRALSPLDSGNVVPGKLALTLWPQRVKMGYLITLLHQVAERMK